MSSTTKENKNQRPTQPAVVIPEVYVINLKRRPDRLKKVTERLQKSLPNDLVVTRVDAIDGRSKENSLTAVQGLCTTFCNLLSGISERFKTDANKRNKWVMILEDDVLVHHDFKSLYSKVKQKLCTLNNNDVPPFVYLGANQPDLKQSNEWLAQQRAIDGLLFRSLTRTHGAFAILYNIEAIEQVLLEPVTNLRLKKPYDNILCDVMAHLDKKSWHLPFVCIPNLMVADVSDSDLRGKRDQTKFAEQKHWDMTLYD